MKIRLSNIMQSKAIGFFFLIKNTLIAKLFIIREKRGFIITKIVTGPFRTGVL